MGFFSNTKSDLLNILAADGEALTFNTRADGPDISFTSVLHRNGEDGTAVVNIPVADVAAPAFADKITDADAVVWRIDNLRESFQGRTFCYLKQASWLETVDLQEFDEDTDDYTDNTTGILALITVSNASEVISAESGHSVVQLEVKTQYLTTPTRRMRFMWVTRELYITGRRPDDSHERYVIFDCVEEES